VKAKTEMTKEKETNEEEADDIQETERLTSGVDV